METPVKRYLERWIVRGLGLVVLAGYGLFLALLLTNEDPLPPQGWPAAACLAVCLLGVGLTWRWERLGGRLVVGAAVALGAAMAYSGLITGLGVWAAGLGLAFPAPFWIVGGLALTQAASRTAREAP
ncbi:MAG: hypothetical protein JNK29_08550 [Anaerolineales bacterium]|nr:hypothetical protein [Anaerolineales bacterium]